MDLISRTKKKENVRALPGVKLSNSALYNELEKTFKTNESFELKQSGVERELRGTL